jgi:hypothetical protein
MGASCLTDTITCQIKKEDPTKTLSEFRLNFDVVRPFDPHSLKFFRPAITLVSFPKFTAKRTLPTEKNAN